MMKKRKILKKMGLFFGVFSIILATSHTYMVGRLLFYFQPTASHSTAIIILFSSFAVLTLLALPLSRLLPHFWSKIIIRFIYPWMGIALILTTCLIGIDITWLILLLFNREIDPHYLGLIALSVAGLLTLKSFWHGLGPVKVQSHSINLERLPSQFDGLRIVQISDLHIGPLRSGRWLDKIVININRLNPDIVVITGDLVDGSLEELQHHIAPLKELQSKKGVFFITGNHEYYSGVDEWCPYIESLGITVLRNQVISIFDETKTESFDLAGIDDWGSRHFPDGGGNLSQALSERSMEKALILLSHQPAAIHEATGYGVDLQLSGHTHGGQIWPFTYLVYLQQPYRQGLHHHQNSSTQIYISPGTGFWGPPMRLGTRAEISELTLRSQSSKSLKS